MLISVRLSINTNSNLNSGNYISKFNYKVKIDLSENPISFNYTNVIGKIYCTTFDNDYENITTDNCFTWYNKNLKLIQYKCNTSCVTD